MGDTLIKSPNSQEIKLPKNRPNFEIIPVIVEHGDVSYEGYIRRLTWTRRRAMWFGVFVLVVIYLAGVMSWLNPITHYLMPPIWLVGGPWAAYKVHKMYLGMVTFRSGRGQCPLCHNAIKIYAHQSRLPFTASCPRCHEEFSGRGLDEGASANS